MLRLLLISLVVCVITACAPTQSTQARQPSAKASATLKGSGLFLVDFDFESGAATAVHVLKSTGNAALDATSIRKFLGWRCKPRTYRQVKVPLTYTITNEPTQT